MRFSSVRQSSILFHFSPLLDSRIKALSSKRWVGRIFLQNFMSELSALDSEQIFQVCSSVIVLSKILGKYKKRNIINKTTFRVLCPLEMHSKFKSYREYSKFKVNIFDTFSFHKIFFDTKWL
jgi:hypothetical protein